MFRTVFDASATAVRIASSMPFYEEAITSITLTIGIMIHFKSEE